MDVDIQKQPTNHLKDRILRFKPIAFVKQNWVVFSLIFIFLLTNIFGLWNIKKYEVQDINGEAIPTNAQNQIDGYIENNFVGKNFFLFSTISLENQISTLSYVKSANIEKVVPNKLEIFLDVLQPEIVAYVGNTSCYVLEEEGYVLEKVCEEDTANCCLTYSTENSLYYFSSSEVDIATMEDGKQKLLIMDNVSKVLKVVKSSQYEIGTINLKDDILEIVLKSLQLFRFSLSDDIQTQLERYIVVINKVKSDNIDFNSIDFRFEKPVLKN